MKILHVIPYSPVPPQFGGALRIFNLMKEMTRNHDVSVVYFGGEGSDRVLKAGFNEKLRKVIRVPHPVYRKFRRFSQLYALVNGRSHFSLLSLSAQMASVLRKEVESHDYDIVQTEFPNMAQYTLGTDAVKILDSHNVEYDLNRRQGEMTTSRLRKFHYREEFRKIRLEEIDMWRRQDLIFTTSGRDRDLIHADVPEVPKIVLPNGVDSGYFTPDRTAAEADTLVFTGVMKYLPNSDGVKWFLDEILPLIREKVPAVKLFVVGSSPPPALVAYASDRVTFTGRVDDVRPFVNRATVSIVPLRMGGGTRLKILESFAMRKPVVSTMIGAEGIDSSNGDSIMLADDPRSFADAVVTLLKDANLREKLASNAYDIMKENYEWSVVGSMLDRAYDEACNGRRHHADAGGAGRKGRR